MSVAVGLYRYYTVRYGPSTHKKLSGVATTTPTKVEAEVPMPEPTPYLDFDINSTMTRDYIYANSPLRYPYHQTMAHRPMDINDWCEIDKDYMRDLDMKKRVIEEQGKVVLDSFPENDAACGELLEVLAAWLPKRYPTLFESLPDGIFNKVTEERFDGISAKRGTDALLVVSRLVQDDFLMGRERADGHVYFVGGLVAFPGFYKLSEKIGLSMEETHRPVPYFNEKILMSVERTLKRFKPHQPFERTSWEIVDDYNLFHHNIADLHEGGKVADDLHPKDYIFRMDKQTFMKLPRSNAIIFGVHPIMRSLGSLADSPLVPQLLLKIHEESDPKLMKYKVAYAYQDKMVPYLNELTKLQIERGLIKGDEPVADFRDLIDHGKMKARAA